MFRLICLRLPPLSSPSPPPSPLDRVLLLGVIVLSVCDLGLKPTTVTQLRLRHAANTSSANTNHLYSLPFIQRRIFDVGPTLYKCYVLCMLGGL